MYYSADFLPLRHIAYIAQLPVFSVQYALLQLHKQKIIVKKKHKRFALFKLNPNHPYVDLLAQLFEADTALQLQSDAKTYTNDARQALQFIHSAQAVFRKIKSV